MDFLTCQPQTNHADEHNRAAINAFSIKRGEGSSWEIGCYAFTGSRALLRFRIQKRFMDHNAKKKKKKSKEELSQACMDAVGVNLAG